MANKEFDAFFEEAEQKSASINEKTENKKQRDERLLDCNKTKTVLFRMIPDYAGGMLDLNYNFNAFKSPVSGKNIPLGVSPTLWGNEDPVKKFQLELYDQDQHDLAKELYPKKRCRVNIFCLYDSSDESANKTCKLLDYSAKEPMKDSPRSGAPLVRFINKLIKGEDAEYTKKQLFDLTSNGITIKMEITKGKDPWPEFEFSVYTGKKNAIFDKFTPEKAKKFAVENGFNLLESMTKPKDDEEIIKVLRSQLLGIRSASSLTQAPSVDFDEGGDDFDVDTSDATDDDDINDLVGGDTSNGATPKSEDSEDDGDLDFNSIMEQFENEDD